MDEKNINLDLSIDEVNQILNSLSKEPFIEVYKLIEKIHLQSKGQNVPPKGE